jgi:YD repeat-containing protein
LRTPASSRSAVHRHRDLITKLDYDFDNRVTTVTNPRAFPTEYHLNEFGNTVKILGPLGQKTEMSWDTEKVLQTQEIDPLDRVTRYEHDERGNVISETIETADFGAVVTAYTYHGTFNKPTSRTEPGRPPTEYAYNEVGDLVTVTDPVGNVTGYRYDAAGRLTSMTSPRQHVTSYSNHHLYSGQPQLVAAPLSLTTQRTYDQRGRLILETDSFGRRTETVYDGMDRVVRITREAGGESVDEVTRTNYYPVGQVRSVVNPNQATTTYALDGANRVISATTELGLETLLVETQYDPNGNKAYETDRRGVRRAFVYDELDRLASVQILSGPADGPTGTVASYTYDLAGNKKSETDISGQTTFFEYDGLYQAKEKRMPEGLTERYAYDEVGDRRSLKDPNGAETLFEYDHVHPPRQVTNPRTRDPLHVPIPRAPGSTRPRSTTNPRPPDAFRVRRLGRETLREVKLEGSGSNGEVYPTETSTRPAPT